MALTCFKVLFDISFCSFEFTIYLIFDIVARKRPLCKITKIVSLKSHLGMFVTTGCSSRRQFVATASRQDTSSRQQNTDSGRQVTASGQFYKPSQAQESKYVIMLCFCYAGLNGKMDLPSMSETS